MPDQYGHYADAARRCELALVHRLHSSAQADQLLIAALSGTVVEADCHRARLAVIDAEIRAAAVTTAVDTPTGARQFQLFLAAKTRDILGVLAETAAENRVQTVRLQQVRGGYAESEFPGISARERDRINRQVLADDISRVEHATTAICSDDMARYENALRVRDGLASNSEDGTNPVLLLTYEPLEFGGRGRVAIAIGDPDTADNTTVLVPGARSSVRGGYLSHPDALNVYHEVSHADPDRSNSVVMWMGYRAPDSFTDPQIAQPSSARAGGKLLADDVNDLRQSHIGTGQVTVIGHSYGSTTVADAAAGFHMHADNVVLVGSPGTDMARRAQDFHLPEGGHVYVGAASSDPITSLGGEPQLTLPGTAATIGLGADPAADDFGSTRFKAETPGLTSPFADHGSYFTPDGESLFSIGDIASGHGDALERDHMTALHRLRSPAFDPERLRLGTGGHRH